MKKYVLPMKNLHFYFDKQINPILTVASGDEITFFTEDANVSYITKETDIVTDWEKMFEECGGCNPMTGPVYIEGVKKGDYIAVDILSVKAGEERKGGYSAHYPAFGALCADYSIQEPLEARTKICQIDGDQGIFKTNDGQREIRFDLNPFIGCIGVAPNEERRNCNQHHRSYCGNVDVPDMKVGATLVLRANVDGALLSLGDVHAAQGDGEITGCALECRGEVTVRVRKLGADEAKYCAWPQINTEETIGALICGEAQNLSDQIRTGYAELVNRMHQYYGFDKIDAYQLLNLVGRVVVGQVLNGSNSCLVKIDKKYL